MNTDAKKSPFGRYAVGGKTYMRKNKLGWWERKEMPRSYDDVEIVITKQMEKRPDLLAYHYYGDSRLFWLVLQYNNIVDVETEMLEGQTLLIPSEERVRSSLLAAN